jgi:hypothetical protein
LSNKTVEMILLEAESFLKNLKLLHGHEHTDGFRLCVISPEGKASEHLIGQMTPANNEAFRKSALRKALHLNARPEHISSGQSRDPAALMYSGAVRTKDGWIIAVAGLTEEWDEVASSVIAYMSGAVEFDEECWQRVQSATNNPHMRALPVGV